jgi:bifunctional UDP-N-acetylglucosamine pyrophosphorylase / glucosamine-1-phosphate N-acetyltransferase
MKSELPKVLHPLLGKPLVQHVIDNVRQSGIDDITVVIGYKGDDVIREIGSSVHYVWQREQLGTGHAVLQAEDRFRGFSGKVLVACGDAPLISVESFSGLLGGMTGNVKASVLTMVKENPTGYGRMIKDADGALLRIVEEKDATDEQKKIREVNSGTYVFNAELLFRALKTVKNDNAQKEYYLPDALTYMISNGFIITTLPLRNDFEGSGINSREELEDVEKVLLERKK